MKTKLISLICTVVGLSLAHSQNLLAHWDMNDGSSGSQSLIPEANSHDCITPHNITYTNSSYSWSTRDSEDGSSQGANCFGGWGSGEYVSFKVTADNNATGNINSLNFDIGNYGNTADPSLFRVDVLKNGTIVSQSPWDTIDGLASTSGPWGASADQNISTNLSTSVGSTDMFEFRILASLGEGRIALDNIRLFGDITCVPEPSTALLGAFLLVGVTFQRRR